MMDQEREKYSFKKDLNLQQEWPYLKINGACCVSGFRRLYDSKAASEKQWRFPVPQRRGMMDSLKPQVNS